MTTYPEKTWNFVDKSKWPEQGAWNDEPDKVQWVDEATGLDCLIHRGPSGALCGYVGVPEGHKHYGNDSENVMFKNEDGEEEYPDVHGGLTFSDFCGKTREDGGGVCHIPYEGRPDNVWWLGFDCAHSGDLCPSYAHLFAGGWETYKELSYVKHQVANLAKQLIAS